MATVRISITKSPIQKGKSPHRKLAPYFISFLLLVIGIGAHSYNPFCRDKEGVQIVLFIFVLLGFEVFEIIGAWLRGDIKLKNEIRRRLRRFSLLLTLVFFVLIPINLYGFSEQCVQLIDIISISILWIISFMEVAKITELNLRLHTDETENILQVLQELSKKYSKIEFI